MFLNEFFEKVDFEKSQLMTAKAWKITQHAELNQRQYLLNIITFIIFFRSIYGRSQCPLVPYLLYDVADGREQMSQCSG